MGDLVNACVVGAGLAGACAAMTLREGGAEVEVISRAPGATALGGGTIDFAGASPAPGATPARRRGGAWLSPAERVVELLERNPAHPYGVLMEPGHEAEALDAALRRFHGWFERDGLGVRGRADRSMLVADTQGVIRVGDGALPSVAAGDLTDLEELAVVALPGLSAWDAGAVGERLLAESVALRSQGRSQGLRVTRVEARWPESWCEAARVPARLAALLDDPGALPTLRELLRAGATPGRLLLFPPVLGLDPRNPVREALSQALGCPVAECVGVPPLHLAGFRIQRALESALDRAGIVRSRGRVAALRHEESNGGHLLSVAEDGPPQRASAAEDPPAAELRRFDTTILATGRFVGGGLREGPGGLEEPILDLALCDARGAPLDGVVAQAATRPEYASRQPLFSGGVRGDPELRPVDASGVARLEGLYIAGDLLAGFDPAVDRSGHGVALLSGMRAGTEALHTGVTS